MKRIGTALSVIFAAFFVALCTSIALGIGTPGISGSGGGSTSASDLTSGTLPDGRFPATLPAASGVNLTALNATQLTSGTVPDARFPATLPAASAANLTAIPAANITGTLPAISGANLTNLPTSSQALTTQVELWDDFLDSNSIQTGPFAYQSVVGTSGAIALLAAETGAMGINRLSTGTDTAGKSLLLPSTYTTGIALGGGAVVVEHRIRIVTLSDGTDTFAVRAGMFDATSGDGTDSVMVRYTHGTNSGKFQFVTRSNTTETAADTGTTVAANTWYRITITINAGATSASCSINGGAATTNATNVPTGAARATAIGFGIIKSAGTTSRNLDADYTYLKWTPTTPR